MRATPARQWMRAPGESRREQASVRGHEPTADARLGASGEHNPRDIDKYVGALPIPRFDANDPVHQLVDLARRGEEVAAGVELSGSRFESLRRDVREALVKAGIAALLDDAVDALILRATAA